MKGLVLDFDGVVADSSRESFAVALATYGELGDGPGLEDRDPETLYLGFVAAMPLGNRAEDFGAVLRAAAEGVDLPDQTTYDAWRATLSEAWLAAFHERYYQVRHERAAGDREAWLASMPPYEPFVELLRRRSGARELAIATAKDRRSVDALLDRYGIADLFPADRVVDKTAGRHKSEHLRRLSDVLGLDFDELTFVDDKVNHLDAVADLGVRCALAGWGYNSPREHELARERGYLVCTLEDAESKLFGAHPAPPLRT